MSISRQDVLHVARLAELDLPEAEVERLAAQLTEIVDYVGRLDPAGADDEAQPPVGPQAARLRQDVVAPIPLAHGPETFAPATVDGFFVVPRLAAMEDG